MKDLNTHVFAIQNIVNRGAVTQNTNLTNAFVGHMLKQARAVLYKRKMDKHQVLSEANYQTICVPLEESLYHNCTDVTVGCTVMKSKCKLPTDIGDKWKPSLIVTNINNEVIPKIPAITYQYKKYSLNSQNKYGWFLEDGYLVIVGNNDLKLVLVKGLWEDPDEVANSFCPDPEEPSLCKKLYTNDFPIDPDLVMPLYQLTIEMMGISVKFPQDNVGDSRTPEQVSAVDPNEPRS